MVAWNNHIQYLKELSIKTYQNITVDTTNIKHIKENLEHK